MKKFIQGIETVETIAVISLKGGVGKTTLTVNLGAALSFFKKKVLLVDLDPQHDLTQILGINPALIKGVENLLAGDMSFDAVKRNYRNKLDFLPAGKELKDLELLLARHYDQHQKYGRLLKQAFENIENRYDYLLIDCPPYAGLLNLNALSFARKVFIPVQCNHLGLNGSKKTISFVYKAKALYNRNLNIHAVVPFMYVENNKHSEAIRMKLQKIFNGRLTNSNIRLNSALAEAPAYEKTIFDYKPLSKSAEDFIRLAHEIIEKAG